MLLKDVSHEIDQAKTAASQLKLMTSQIFD